jgi:hypothetical protein
MNNRSIKNRNIPVLILGRNRPNHLSRLLHSDALKECTSIYIFLDGPEIISNDNNDNSSLRDTQQIAREFLDKRKGKILISKNHLGCYRGVTTGIDWFFLLHRDAIATAGRALDEFRNEISIASICLYRVGKADNSYGFTISDFISSWGWATWRNRWVDFDHEVEQRLLLHPIALLRHGGIPGLRRWYVVARRLRRKELDSWAYRWMFSVWLKRKRNAVVPFNLVENHGFGDSATHTKKGQTVKIEERFDKGRVKWKINSFKVNKDYDRLLMDKHYGIKRH